MYLIIAIIVAIVAWPICVYGFTRDSIYDGSPSAMLFAAGMGTITAVLCGMAWPLAILVALAYGFIKKIEKHKANKESLQRGFSHGTRTHF